MMLYPPFVTHVLEQLRVFEDIVIRRMFGGYGIYRRGIMFALVDKERLFFKVDAVTKHEYTDIGCVPFSYERAGKSIAFSYWEVPAHVHDNTDLFFRWASKAYDAAVKSKIKDKL